MNEARQNVRTVVVGGYLGAGKTTLVNHALATAAGRRVGVIVNDFGRLNIDASLLVSNETIELANGCVCCTLADGLPSAFERLLSYRPALDAIVVEASGVADPRKIAAYARLAGLRDARVVVVVDASAIRSLQRDRFVAGEIDRQIRSAGLLVVNKRDLVHDTTAADIRRRLHELAPAARIVESSFGKVDWPDLLAPGGDHLLPEERDDGVHDDRVYESWSTVVEVLLERSNLEGFAAALAPHALRAKGIVALREDSRHRYIWQWTPQTTSLERQDEWGNERPQSSIVVVGRGALELSSVCAALARTHLLGDPS
ncbi:MAG TPA: GTP-binding protein [Candidatus Acidoferrum sp.]|nr:GTP-binding protein [Candidatus Acidoferrum sp.]